jgi:hypothetical protein
MPDLTPESVRDQLIALGLTPQDDEDLAEITHRLNALREALHSLDLPDLDAQEPLTVLNLRDSTA